MRTLDFKKASLFILTLWVGIFLFSSSISSKEMIIVNLFDDRLCPVCSSTKAFLEELKKDEFEGLEVRVYSISDKEKLNDFAQSYGLSDYDVMAPTLFINDNFFQFSEFGPHQKDMIVRALSGEKVIEEGLIVTIPLIKKEINIKGWSLPFITLVLGSLDGINICSIGALILVLSIVLTLDSKRKTLFFGSLFIVTGALIYGAMVFAWGKVFEMFIGQLETLRLIIGLATLGGAIYFTMEFLRSKKKTLTCQASDSKLTIDATNKLREAFETSEKKTLSLMIGSVIFFAIIVTLVDLPCSVGLPIAFTGILVERGLSLTAYTLYILGYLFFYVFIELVIFFGAVFTKKIWFAGPKIARRVILIGALVLYYLAFYYLFK